MLQHYPWWQKGLKKYQYFEAVDGGKVKVDGVSLEWALMQREWDVLSLQLSSTEMREYSVEDSLALHREARDVLYGYLRQQYPAAELYFHQNWSYEIGHTRDGGYVMKDLEQQMAYTEHIRQIATGVCAENNVGRINTGDAWELYRAACDAAGQAVAQRKAHTATGADAAQSARQALPCTLLRSRGTAADALFAVGASVAHNNRLAGVCPGKGAHSSRN
jgi:hypothetical protein